MTLRRSWRSLVSVQEEGMVSMLLLLSEVIVWRQIWGSVS